MIVQGWVVNWGDINTLKAPNVTVDLFFSSREKFEELLGWDNMDKEILVPITVPDGFDQLDFIPDNY